MLNRTVKPFYTSRYEICYEQNYCTRHLPKLQQIWKEIPEVTTLCREFQELSWYPIVHICIHHLRTPPDQAVHETPSQKKNRKNKESSHSWPTALLAVVSNKAGDRSLLNSMKKQGLWIFSWILKIEVTYYLIFLCLSFQPVKCFSHNHCRSNKDSVNVIPPSMSSQRSCKDTVFISSGIAHILSKLQRTPSLVVLLTHVKDQWPSRGTWKSSRCGSLVVWWDLSNPSARGYTWVMTIPRINTSWGMNGSRTALQKRNLRISE